MRTAAYMLSIKRNSHSDEAQRLVLVYRNKYIREVIMKELSDKYGGLSESVFSIFAEAKIKKAGED